MARKTNRQASPKSTPAPKDATKKPQARAKQPETVAGTEPSVRVFTRWTPGQIVSAEMSADRGDIRQAANLCDWMLGDERIGSLIHGRAQALLGLSPSFDASGDRRRSERAVKALDVQEDWWSSYPETELTLMLSWGILLGLAPFRHTWVVDRKTKRRLPRPEFWHPQHLRQNERGEWMVRVNAAESASGFSFGDDEPMVPGDGQWILHMPFGKHRPWTMGLWRGLGRMALLKSLAIGDWARHSEKAALLVATNSPRPVAGEMLDEVSTKEQRQELAQQLYDRGRDGVVTLPPFFDLKLVETIANTKAIYDAQIQMANDAIAVAIRGGNLTTDAQGGSFAATEVQKEGGDDVRLAFDAQALTTTLHDQSLVWWATYNFGDPYLAPWPVYPVIEQEDLARLADAWRGAGFAVDQFLRLGLVPEDDGTALITKLGLSGLFKIGPGGLKATAEELPKPAVGAAKA